MVKLTLSDPGMLNCRLRTILPHISRRKRQLSTFFRWSLLGGTPLAFISRQVNPGAR
jgi:hypothetical protein